MTDDTTRTEYDSAFMAGLAAADYKQIGEQGVPYAVVPEGCTLATLEPYLRSPNRIRTKVKCSDVNSFLRYLLKFGEDTGTQVFADRDAHTFTAILDYHADSATPAWCDHRATLTLKKSDAWTTWTGRHSQPFSQIGFAEWLEDNYIDIIEPDSAAIVQAAQTLEAKKTVTFKSGNNLTNGSIELRYEENVEGKGKGNLVVPAKFKLLIPVFEGSTPVEIEARLRYRIKDDVLTFTYLLHRPADVLKSAFEAVLADVAEGFGNTPLMGAVKE